MIRDRRPGKVWGPDRPEVSGVTVGSLVALFLIGLVVGLLGRLALPGPDPMSLPVTALVGIGGSLLAGAVVHLVFGRPAGLTAAVLGATALVWLIRRRRSRV